jgi:hypothetical protein
VFKDHENYVLENAGCKSNIEPFHAKDLDDAKRQAQTIMKRLGINSGVLRPYDKNTKTLSEGHQVSLLENP